MFKVSFKPLTENFKTDLKEIVKEDTSDATATADTILDGYTAYANNKKVTGNIPVQDDIVVSNPNTTNFDIADGYYKDKKLALNIDNLIAENIANGVNILGIVGELHGEIGDITVVTGEKEYTTATVGDTIDYSSANKSVPPNIVMFISGEAQRDKRKTTLAICSPNPLWYVSNGGYYGVTIYGFGSTIVSNSSELKYMSIVDIKAEMAKIRQCNSTYPLLGNYKWFAIWF